MKILYSIIICSLFFTSAYAQEASKSDSLIADLKIYLAKNVHPPAQAVENHIQGTVVVSFNIDDNKKITNIYVIKSLSRECDAEVLRVFQRYKQTILLPSAEYQAGITFLIENKKRRKKDVLDKSVYKNFLVEVNVVSNFPN